MRCRGSRLPLRDAACLPPWVLFHLQLGREQGWQREPWGQWGGQAPTLDACSPGQMGGAVGQNGQEQLAAGGFFRRVASGASPLGVPRMRSVGTAEPAHGLSLHRNQNPCQQG